MARQCLLKRRIEDPSPVFAAGIEPSQSGLQLITPRLPRPARFFGQGLLLRQRDHWMIHPVAEKVECQRQRGFLSSITKLLISGGAKYRHEAAHDDADVEKVRTIGSRLERKRRSRCVPGLIGEISRRPNGRIQVLRLAGARVEKCQSAYRVSRNLGRNSSVGCGIRLVETRDAAVAFLDSGVQEPTARVFEK